MSRLLASYRWRRRFLWLVALGAFGGVVAILALEIPNPKNREAPVSKRPIAVTPERTPRSVALKGRSLARALAVATAFVNTAVAREHIERAWPLASDELKQGLSRRQWDSGNIPVAPYPVREGRWAVDYSYSNEVGFQIALFPKHGSKLQPEVFLLDLKATGKGGRRHWLVTGWNPTPIGNAGSPPTGGDAMDLAKAHVPAASARARLSASWVLLPVGLLSLVLLIPLSIGVTSFYRRRKIEHAYLRGQNAPRL